MDHSAFPLKVMNKMFSIIQSPIENHLVNHKLPGLIAEKADIPKNDAIEKSIQGTLFYLEKNKKNGPIFSYLPGKPPLLYATCYAVGILNLTKSMQDFSEGEKQAWISFINSYQSDDGLYRDPELSCNLAEQVDWWGWRHLTLHVIGALSMLGGKPEKPFKILEPFKKKGEISSWLESRDWNDAASASNEIQNLGTLLISSRDQFEMSWCEDVLIELYNWLSYTQDPSTGLWGRKFDTLEELSQGVQAGYHIWNLFFFDQKPIQYVERAIDSCLNTQNNYGGFGVKRNSSACEDIDTIDPLARWYFQYNYRRLDIVTSFERALPWILSNQNDDGGWVFRRYERFPYGHPKMTTGMQQSSMFPSWFRLLSLAYILKVLSPGNEAFHLKRHPGMQFWQEEN